MSAAQAIPVPADFAQHYMRSNEALSDHYGYSINTIKKFRRKTGLRNGKRGGVDPIPAPEGFREVAPLHNIEQLARMFHRSPSKIKRWCREEGVKTACVRSQPKLVATRSTKHFSPQNKPHLDMTRAGRAAEFLRPRYRIHRCDFDGRVNPNGAYFRCETRTLSPAQLIEKALSRGWDEHGWRRVA